MDLVFVRALSFWMYRVAADANMQRGIRFQHVGTGLSTSPSSLVQVAQSRQWEVILLHIILIAFLGLLYFASTQYLPAHIRFIVSRAQYYLFGGKDSLERL